MLTAIRDRIVSFERVNWRQLLPIQPDNFKHVYNFEHLDQSIRKHGFALPFAAWRDQDGNVYCVDGHTRVEVLNNIEGVPDQLPAFFIEAKDRQEAATILLEVYNQKHNPIDSAVFEEWIEVEEIPLREINLQSLNMVSVEEEGGSEAGESRGEGGTVIKLQYQEQEYEQVREALSRIAQTPEQAVWELLNL